MNGERIVVTGYAIMTPLGNDINGVWDQLCDHKHAVKEYTDLRQEGFRFAKACRMEDLRVEEGDGRGYTLAKQCILQAIENAGINLPENCGLFVGSTIGESSVFEAAAKDTTQQPQQNNVHAWCKRISKLLNIHGPSAAFGTACAAGNYAIGSAADHMRHYGLQAAIAGGAEPFSRIAMTGFSRSRAMTNDYCKPFDKQRNGMILGEGAAFFILETEEHALQRGAVPLAVIGNLGLSCDAFHPTAPLPDGSGMMQAMKEALRLQQMEPADISWVCAHGSGTIASDAAEATAIAILFGDYGVDVAGYKGAFGHSLGAATAIEAALCIASLEKQAIAPTINHSELADDFRVKVIVDLTPKPIKHVMNCGYAFGGINSALIISNYKS